MPSPKVKCPDCRSAVAFPISHLGERIRCHHCRASFTVTARKVERRRVVRPGPAPVKLVRSQELRPALLEMVIDPARLARAFPDVVDPGRYSGGRVGPGDVVAGLARLIGKQPCAKCGWRRAIMNQVGWWPVVALIAIIGLVGLFVKVSLW